MAESSHTFAVTPVVPAREKPPRNKYVTPKLQWRRGSARTPPSPLHTPVRIHEESPVWNGRQVRMVRWAETIKKLRAASAKIYVSDARSNSNSIVNTPSTPPRPPHAKKPAATRDTPGRPEGAPLLPEGDTSPMSPSFRPATGSAPSTRNFKRKRSLFEESATREEAEEAEAAQRERNDEGSGEVDVGTEEGDDSPENSQQTQEALPSAAAVLASKVRPDELSATSGRRGAVSMPLGYRDDVDRIS